MATFTILFLGLQLFALESIPLKNKNSPTEKFINGLIKTCAAPRCIMYKYYRNYC